MTNPSPERCSQLRKLHAQITNEIKNLQISIDAAEREGVGNPLAMLTTLKQLKASLHTISLEMADCPPVPGEEAAAPVQEQVKATQTIRRWFPPEEQESDEVPSIIDEE